MKIDDNFSILILVGVVALVGVISLAMIAPTKQTTISNSIVGDAKYSVGQQAAQAALTLQSDCESKCYLPNYPVLEDFQDCVKNCMAGSSSTNIAGQGFRVLKTPDTSLITKPTTVKVQFANIGGKWYLGSQELSQAPDVSGCESYPVPGGIGYDCN